jgi:formate dehydrogenase accessory protein FdhE
MCESWQRRIDRAADLAQAAPAGRALLVAYRDLLRLQRDCYEALGRSHERVTGSLDRDLSVLRVCVAPMLQAVAAIGPPALAQEARQILDGAEPAIDAMLLAGWRASSGHHFFPKIVLQPYAQCLASTGVRPVGRNLPSARGACPFCGGAPQLSILRSTGDAEGGGRQLLCATCLTTWAYGRIACARCGEEDEQCLGYFHSAAFNHLRVDACDTCKYYLKTVDLTRQGNAVPLVDEVAGGPLDLWARDHGYQKIELNLVGL